jgi:transposase
LADKRTGRVLATAFCEGRTHDFALFKQSRTALAPTVACLGDSGYQGLDGLHANSRTPQKKSKRRPLTDEQKADNREISRQRIGCEHVIGRLKVFRILSERYRNRRRRFGLRFNLIAAICNLECDE